MRKVLQLKVLNYFLKKAASWMFDWVPKAPLVFGSQEMQKGVLKDIPNLVHCAPAQLNFFRAGVERFYLKWIF